MIFHYIFCLDCAGKCLHLQICRSGECECMSGYSLMHDICIRKYKRLCSLNFSFIEMTKYHFTHFRVNECIRKKIIFKSHNRNLICHFIYTINIIAIMCCFKSFISNFHKFLLRNLLIEI